ncbi:MAG: MotA/TolQ/ExbB proton channel family protein [Candidatus Margulisiibacteriota bacterium]
MFNLVLKGGWMMVPIILGSIIGLAVFLERYKSIKTNELKSAEHMKAIRELLEIGHLKDAYQFCLSNASSIANILRGAMKNYERSYQEIQDSIQSVGRLEASRLEQNLNIIYTVATVSPLLGFLGTVLGMVKAFQKIEALGGGVNATVLAGGIWEALITTVAGLLVGIPMLIAYNYMAARIDSFVLGLEENSIEMMDLVLSNKERKTNT